MPEVTPAYQDDPIRVSGDPMRDRYNLDRVRWRLDKALDARMAGDLNEAIDHLILAVAHQIDYTRAKERGDV